MAVRASRLIGRKITTFEVLEEKARLAAGTFKAAQIEEVVELVTGDAPITCLVTKRFPFVSSIAHQIQVETTRSSGLRRRFLISAFCED